MRFMPFIFIILFFLFCILLDAYIFCDIRKFVPSKARRPLVWIHGCMAAFGLSLLVVSVALMNAGEDAPVSTIMWMLYAFVSIYVSKFIYAICSLIGRLFMSLRKAKKINYGSFVGIVLGIITFVTIWWGALITRYDVDVVRITVSSPKIPERFNGYRIVQFSDAHVGTWGQDTAFVCKLVREINSLKPDLIVFTGDLVNSETSEMEPFLNALSRLKAKDGVYSVLGNHDYGDYKNWHFPSERDTNNALMAIWQRQIGWRLLNNESVFLKRANDSIALIGVENWGEPPFRQYGDLSSSYGSAGDTFHNLNDGNFKILLSHNPEHWNREVSKNTNIDLTLSGHTHAMQMMIGKQKWKWSPAKWRYPYWAGLYQRVTEAGEPSLLYVNIGCGEVGIPARLGTAVPEITEITLEHEN